MSSVTAIDTAVRRSQTALPKASASGLRSVPGRRPRQPAAPSACGSRSSRLPLVGQFPRATMVDTWRPARRPATNLSYGCAL